MTQPKTPWLLREPSANAAARLFCLPFAGIGASAYRRWSARGTELDVCPIQLPGRENRAREPVPTQIRALAAEIATALLPYLDRPFALFGHCMGGLLAYEVERALANGGHPKATRLYVSAARAPHSSHRGPLHACMSDAELAVALQNSSAGEVDAALLPLVLPLAIRLLRADLEMCSRYQPQPSDAACPITTFGWREDRGMPLDELAGWNAYGDVTRYLVDGDHFAVQTAGATLLAIIQSDFETSSGMQQQPKLARAL